MDLRAQTLRFLKYWKKQAISLDVEEIDRVEKDVVLKDSIDLNMLMDPSDVGMPYEAWCNGYNLSVGLLLKLRRTAV